MTTADLWALLAAGIATIVGFLIALHVTERRERRRKADAAAARYAAAEAEFWAALVRYVDRARADIEAPVSETPIHDELAVEQLRADLDRWGS